MHHQEKKNADTDRDSGKTEYDEAYPNVTLCLEYIEV